MNILSNIKWYQAIRTKLIFTILLTTTLVLGATGYFAYKYIENNERAGLAELAEVSATRLSKHLVIPMWNLDREQVGELLSAEMQEQRVAAIVVRDEDSSTLFSARERSEDGTAQESSGTVVGNYISVEREVTNNNDKIGLVSIYVTPDLMEKELQQFREGVLATVVGLNIIIFIIMMIVLGGMLVRPLQALSDAAGKISRGDMNQVVEVNSADEIGHLAMTFNRMQTSLKVAIRRLMDNKKPA